MTRPVVIPHSKTCYRHGDRHAGVSCQRCDQPICPSCMHQAPVGFHCPECIRSGIQRVIQASQIVGPPPSGSSAIWTSRRSRR